MLQLLFSFLLLIFVCLPAHSQLTQNFTWVEKSIDEKVSKNCSVTFKYPEFRVTMDKVSDAHIRYINKQIVSLAKDETNKFKSEFETLEQSRTDWTNGELTNKYKIYSRNNCIVSLSFYIEKYIAPSAHPSHSTLTLNYDFSRGKNLELKNIFQKDSNYLDILSKRCYDYLLATVQNPDKKWIKEGTKPIAANFKKFYITPDSLCIVFNEYAVDCYAGGQHTVPMLLKILSMQRARCIIMRRCSNNAKLYFFLQFKCRITNLTGNSAEIMRIILP